jgi:hypothetical protein
MFSAAMITDRNGSLDWTVVGCARFGSAEHVWREPATDGAVLRWEDGSPVELIVEACCSRCPGRTDGFLVGTGFDDDLAAMRLCGGCALSVPPTEMLRWVDLDQAAAELGVQVRLASGAMSEQVRGDRLMRTVLDDLEAALVGSNQRERVADPQWREQAVRAAAGNPRVVVGIADAVAGLGDGEVLDLYPALAELGRQLPRAAARWLESSGHVAAARLGLPCLGAGA